MIGDNSRVIGDHSRVIGDNSRVIGDSTKVSIIVQLSDNQHKRVLYPVPEPTDLGTHQQPPYLPHTDLTTSGPGVGVGFDSFTPRKLDKISTTVPVIHKTTSAFSTPNTFSRSYQPSDPNYPPSTVGPHFGPQSGPQLGPHSGMPGFTKTNVQHLRKRFQQLYQL